MSAKHVLLGLLLQGPAYPYQLADRLEQRMGPAWAINSGHLYQTTKRIEREGLTAPVECVAERPRNRHIVAITASGEEEFERWWEEPTSEARLSRRSLLAKITFAGPERLKDAPKQIEAYELDRTARLKELLRAREAINLGGPKVRADQVLLGLNLTAEIIQLEGELEFARHAYGMVSWLLNREAIWPSGQERDAALDKRQGAREELFGRIAASHLRSVSSEQEPGNDG
ncbi:MAG: PadR family transcriptional regulator [Solirubrobacterales bacterium]